MKNPPSVQNQSRIKRRYHHIKRVRYTDGGPRFLIFYFFLFFCIATVITSRSDDGDPHAM